ncbi:protein kinase C delta type-like [Aquarana catesbeiana]|uniref:protein kinase C delta type-like n=1 Tax=Aquarana catesbeiana TaxID=8400 RepID=UPI003CC96FEC
MTPCISAASLKLNDSTRHCRPPSQTRRSEETSSAIRGDLLRICRHLFQVYLVTHRDTLTRVAVKMVKKESMVGNPISTLNEREVLEMVQDNPFCAQAYATFQAEKHLSFVLEYMGQGDLAGQIEETWLTLPTIRRMSAELLCGVQLLHSRGIIHRDLKPANILIHLNGHVKIADFGAAATGMFGQPGGRRWNVPILCAGGK